MQRIPCGPEESMRTIQCLKHCLIAGLLAAMTCLVQAEERVVTQQAPGKLVVSQAPALDPNDPLALWFKEQDSLLDDILLRLARIEVLVKDLHRLITQMPDQAVQPVNQSASSPPPAPQALPDRQVDEESNVWPVYAGTGLLLVTLLALGLARKFKERKAEVTAAPDDESHGEGDRDSSVPPSVSPGPSAPNQPHARVEKVEMDQALELAEIMLSMGLGHGAAQTLAEQIKYEPKQALRHWMKLLEIYRKNGQKGEFERSAEELRQHFNVKPEDWQAPPNADASLEDYAHIAARLTELWGGSGSVTYMQNLLNDNRGGARLGFPQAVAEELLLLIAMRKASGRS